MHSCAKASSFYPRSLAVNYFDLHYGLFNIVGRRDEHATIISLSASWPHSESLHSLRGPSLVLLRPSTIITGEQSEFRDAYIGTLGIAVLRQSRTSFAEIHSK